MSCHYKVTNHRMRRTTVVVHLFVRNTLRPMVFLFPLHILPSERIYLHCLHSKMNCQIRISKFLDPKVKNKNSNQDQSYQHPKIQSKALNWNKYFYLLKKRPFFWWATSPAHKSAFHWFVLSNDGFVEIIYSMDVTSPLWANFFKAQLIVTSIWIKVDMRKWLFLILWLQIELSIYKLDR